MTAWAPRFTVVTWLTRSGNRMGETVSEPAAAVTTESGAPLTQVSLRVWKDIQSWPVFALARDTNRTEIGQRHQQLVGRCIHNHRCEQTGHLCRKCSRHRRRFERDGQLWEPMHHQRGTEEATNRIEPTSGS